MSLGADLSALIQIFLGKNLVVNGTTVPVATLLKGLGTLAAINWPGVIKAIEAGVWTQESAPLEDVLQLVGLFLPPVAIVASDLDAVLPVIQFILTHTNAAGAESPVGQNPTYDALFPSTHSPDTKTNEGWPTADQP